MHTFKNFKNFTDASLNVMNPMTLVIGRNGSGKSNAIEAVELLAQIAHGRPLHEITDIGRGSGKTFEIRGGLPGCLKQDQDEFGDASSPYGKFTLGFEAALGQKPFSYSVTIGVHNSKICSEKLYWNDELIFDATFGDSSDLLKVTYNNFKQGGRKPTTQLAADRSVLSQYDSFVMIDNIKKSKLQQKANVKQREASRLVSSIERHLNAAYVFDLNSKLMRNYERSGQQILSRDGSNLSSVLYGLEQGEDKDKNTLARIFNNLNKLPDEPFSNFEFIKTPLNDVLLALKCTDNSLIDARLLSDGTLRALAILTALETVPTNSRIIIEEMDNGIHPSRVEVLLDAIWEASNRRNLNVLITTHNPATLDGLDKEQIESVVVCYHDSSVNSSKLLSLSDLPDADILLERGKLGDLVTRRVLEQHLMPNFAEDRKAKATAWLESMQ